MKMTGGDCQDTLTPLSQPKLASSGHTGMLTGAVAWSRDGGGDPAAEEKKRGAQRNTKECEKKRKQKGFWVKTKNNNSSTSENVSTSTLKV